MAKPFDATLKQLIDRYAVDWSRFVCEQAGLPPDTPAEPLDADLSTISPQADKLFRVGPPAEGLIHLELQSSWSRELPSQLHFYNTFAEYRYGPPVRSLLLLLRPEANAVELTGLLVRSDESGEYLRFRYRLIRLWEMPCTPLLTGPLGLIPLGLLTNEAQRDLSEQLRRADDRLARSELSAAQHAEILTACHILLGLRYDNVVVRGLFQRLRTMRESSTYQAILAEGREEGELRGLREAILDGAEGRFGSPPTDATDRLDAIAARDRLRRISRRLALAADWDDLLSTP